MSTIPPEKKPANRHYVVGTQPVALRAAWRGTRPPPTPPKDEPVALEIAESVGMTLKLEFWGWDKPVLELAVATLAARGSAAVGTPLDLSRLLVVVPTRQAGRRLLPSTHSSLINTSIFLFIFEPIPKQPTISPFLRFRKRQPQLPFPPCPFTIGRGW